MAAQRIYHILLASTALGAVSLAPTTPVFAGPEDGTVTAGSATITQSGLSTSIHQSSDRAIIDWRSFDVNSNESVRFFQPGSSSITLNRINDSKASLINGQIEANGHILLLNQNGIVFGSTSRVDVAGLIATTGRINDDAFMSGATTLSVTPGDNHAARIINNGMITARDAGLVGLVGPHVENNGIINAHLGKVTLAGAERYTLDLAGDNLISIDVSDMVNGSATNTGRITADGGTITMTAARARDAVEQSIINTGTLQANRVGTRNGRIVLSAGGNRAGDTGRGKSTTAAIKQAGKIQASAGAVEILGDSIHLTETSEIDTSAVGGGGTINIGGSYQGGSDRVTSTWVQADQGSRTRSSGDIGGDGGSIVFWADRLMSFRGYAEAEGGDESGDGGLVEVSGKNHLIFDGQVSTTAANGKTGMLLLDPTNIEITTSPDQNVTGVSPFTPDADDVVSYLNATTLLNALASTSVIVQTRATGAQLGDITVNAALTWLSGNTLTLDAHHDIIINQAINGANLTLSAGNDVQINAALTGTGLLHILPQSAGGTIGVGTGAAGTLQLSNSDLGNITDGWSTIRIGRSDGAGAITLNARAWSDNLEIYSNSGAITVNGTQTMGANNLTIHTDADLVLNAALTGTGNLTIEQSTVATSIGLGTGQIGNLNLTTAEIANITNGWNTITVGRSDGTGAINIAALTWNDNLTVQSTSGVISVNGTQTMGANNLTLVTDADLALGGALTGTGILTVRAQNAATGIGLGTGQAGALVLNDTELGNITNGWSNLVFGRTDGSGAINVGVRGWNDNLTLQTGTGAITINGAQSMSANNLTFISNGNPLIGAALNGTGTLSFQTVSPGTSIGLAGEAGDLNLSTADLANITDGWSQIAIGSTTGTGALTVGAHSWNDALLLQTGSGLLTINGTQAMGANTLTLSTASDIGLNANLTGTGTLTIQGAAAGTTLGLAGEAGNLTLDAIELGRITDGWSNIAIGRTDGTGTLAVGAATWNDNLTLQSNTGVITIAGAQTMGANALTFSTGGDVALNAALTGTGTLNFRGVAAGTTIGLAGQAGALNLTALELGQITDGWTNIVVGRTDGTGAIGLGAATWNDALTLQSNTGVITVAGAQTMGANALTIATDADLILNAALTGSGTLNLRGNTASTTIGLAGQAGTLNLTTLELGRITNGWSSILIGRTDGTGAIGIGAATWNDALTLQSSSGVITVAGAQTMGANPLTIRTDADLVLNAALTGTGDLVIEQNSAATTIGLGNAQAGTLNLNNTEIANITNGWNSLTFGRTDGSALINIGALTWNDTLTVQSGTGIISVNGIQTMGANNLTYMTDGNLAVGAALNGTGTLNIRSNANSTTIGVGTGQAGALQLTNAEAGNLDNTWSNIIIGHAAGTGDINIGALTWVDPMTYQSSTGAININGAQAMGANNLTFISDANPLIGAALGGTGTLSFQTATNSTTIGLGGAAGTFNLSSAELLNITDGWTLISVGQITSTGAVTANAHTWSDALLLQSGSGIITIAGAQNMGANTLTIGTDSDLAINAGLIGTGTLNLRGTTAATTIGVAGGVGALDIGLADLANITDGWSNIVIGTAAGTGALTVNAATWADNLTLQTGAGILTIAGAQSMGANNLILSADSDIALNSNLTGTGILTLQGTTAATTMGLAGQAGAFNLDAVELGRITDGWSSIVIGRTDGTGAIAIGAETWTDNVTLQSNTGVITIAGAQAMGANNLIIRSDADLVLNSTLAGSGILTLQGNTASTTIGLAGQAGTLNLDVTEMTRLSNGWSEIVIGRTDGTGAVAVGANSWVDPVTFQSGTGVITIAGAQAMAANALTFRTDGDIALNAALGGNTTLTFVQATASTGIGLGAAQAGALNLTVAEVANITNGWNSLVFGRTDGTGAINMATLTWNDHLTLQSGTGVINVNSTQTMAAGNNLTIVTDADIALTGNLTGSGAGVITITQASVGTVIGLGAGAVGTVNLTAVEIGRITDGWTGRVFGRVDGSGGINVTANTWLDPLTLRSGTGVISITGAQTMAANNLTITTDADLNVGAALNSTGTLTISGQTASTTMGIGTGQLGTIQLSDAEAGNLDNTWTNIIFGRVDGTGDINVGALTWVDPITYRTLTGGISINGTQTMTLNSLTITTDGDLNVGGTLSSTGTGTLSIFGQSVGTTMGLGTGQLGTIQLSDAEVTNLSNGWANILIGRTNGSGDINVGAATWLDPLTLRTSTGQIIINGQQTMGANNLTITTDANLEVLGALLGTGTLSISGQTATTSFGIGTGQLGTIQLSDAEVANLQSTWANIFIGATNTTGVMNVGALTWVDPLTLRTGSGLMTIAGTQTMDINALTISTDSAIVLSPGADLTGSGNLIITTSAVGTTMGLGNAQAGTLNLNTTEIGQITDGWNSITIGNAGGTGIMNVGALTFNDALTLRNTTAAINLNGALNMSAGNNLTLTNSTGAVNISNGLTTNGGGNVAITTAAGVIGVTSAVTLNGGGNLTLSTNSNMNIGAGGSLTGTGNLVIQATTAATTIGLGNGAAGGLQLTDVELGRITDGWASHTYGQAGGTGIITVGANTWTDNVTLLSQSGAINITGAIDVGANNLTITTNSNPTFSGTLAGSGILTIQQQAVGTIMTIAGAATGVALENSDLGNILNGWSGIVFGRNDATGAMNIGAYTWQYDTTFKTGSGLMTIGGAQTSTGNAMTYETDNNIAINANISGTGRLTIRGSANTTSVGIAGGAGTLAVDATELGRIQDGWSQLVFGKSTQTGVFNANTRTWTDNVQFISGSGLMTVGAQTMNTATNLTLTTDSNLAISANLVGTGGKLTIETVSPGIGIGVGTGQAGTLVLDAAEIGRLGTVWTNGIQIGNAASTSAINIGTNSWTQPMTFLTQGNIVLNGVQTSNRTSGNSLVFASLGGNFVNSTGSATPINAGTGTARYLIYSFSAATDSYGTMTPPGATGMQTYFSYGPGAVVEAGNRIIYSTGAPKVIYIQIDNKTKVYGDTIPLLTWTYIGGLQGGDAIGNAITNSNLSAAGAMVTDNAGTTTAITGMFSTGLGYTVSITDGTLTVIKAPVTVQANAASREYGAANPAFTVNYTGLRNGDTAADIDTGASAATTATLTSNVGTYNITSSGAVDNNYVFNYVNGTLTITKADLTITADNQTREYGDVNPALTVSYSGFLNGDTAAVINTAPTIDTTAVATTDVGNVDITLTGGTDNNYNLILVNGTLSITKATLTATADNQTRAYGDANPALTTTYTGFKNSETALVIDTAATAVTAATALSNVGTYAITTSGAADTNYDFVYVAGSLDVTKAMLTITADDKTRIYGDANPALTVSYSGFKNGETSAILDTAANAATGATILSDVGSYAITASGAADTNYDFTYVAGNLAITKATLTATAGNGTREYGDANPAFTVSYSGFKNGETQAVIDVLGTASSAATLTSNVGNYATTASGASDGNYDFSYVAGNLAITKATLTATANNQTRDYGDANPALTTSYTGFKNGETSAVIDTAATAVTTATALTNVGSYAITTSGASDINYNFNYVDGVLTIDKATLTITADNKTRVYGDANPALTVSYSGFKNGETSAVLDTAANAATGATILSNVGSYAITASGAADTNYDFAYVDGSMAITKAMLTVTANSETRVYGDANPAFGVSYSGFKNSETSAVLDTGASASTAATILTDVGSYAITAAGGVDGNYDFAYVAGTLAITKADLTITADNKTREYGDANPALTVSYSGFKNGDTSAVLNTAPILATAATALSNVGSYAITLSGGTDNNYNLILQDGSLSVTKATLTATADNQTREYGDANPALTTTYSGFKNGETAAVIDTAATAITGATVLSNVGSYAITTSGAADTNYDFVYVAGNLAITTSTITVTANNATREYGDANPALGVSYSGFKNGETSAVLDTGATAATTATALSNVGSYSITASGAADTNYDFVYADGSLAITKATLTATADNQTREYGDANPALTVSYTGFKNGENYGVIDTGAAAVTAANALSNVGSYTITASSAADTNYDFVYVAGNLAITKAMLTATADNQTREYGDANPGLTTTYTGFKNGETSSVIDTAATATTTATALTNVGSYIISTAGASDANYDFTYVDGSLSITKSTLTATADNKTREYGDANPALTVSYTGFKNGETASVIDAGATAITAADALSNVGSYIISASGASDTNYDFVYADGSLSVTKATVTVTADNATREYGDANPALGVSYSGFKNGETSAVLDTGATATTMATALSNVGSYAITASGAADANYDFAYVNGSLSITKATLTATANNQTREYGDANPALTVSYTGFKNGETSAVIDTGATASTVATALSNVGSYAITVAGASDANYDFVYADGSLSITKATLTATANNQTREYGDANPALTVSYTGFKNGETSAVIDTGATASTVATALSNVGSYAITVAGASDANYDFVYADGSLSITKATLTATADNQTREYGDANPALTVSYTGFKNGETSAVIDTGATAATLATALSNVGSYAITASGAADSNYDFVYANGALSITKATVSVTADDKTREYGLNNPLLTASYSGLKNGETAAVLDTAVTLTTGATIGSNVGTYAITASGAADVNYDFAYTNGTMTITKATLTITADDKSRDYGDANPALTLSYAGFRNGDTISALDAQANVATTATTLSDVGAYGITVSGGSDSNYDYAYVNGTLTIDKADLVITADDQIREYGDANPALTLSYSGFKNGETSAVLDGAPAIGTLATALSNVADYAITLTGGSDNNYNYVLQNGTLSVTKATLTATADNQTREYGDANPVLTVAYSGFKNGETSAVIDTGVNASTAANAFSNVGSYAITTSGGLDNNYAFAYVNGTLAITQAAVTVTVNSATREYGLANPAFTATYAGLKNGETSAVIDTGPLFSTAALIGSDVGTYTITASGAADTNYSFNFVSGNLTITQAALTVRADNQIRLYNDPNPPLTYSLTGLRNGDTAAVLAGLAINTAATPLSPVGSYAITVGGATATNYSLTYVQGSLSVVDVMPVPTPDPLPTSPLPGTADNTISNPGYVGAGYNPLYNTPPGYIFMNNTGRPGHETEEGSLRTQDGYITIFYYQNPFEETFGEPLLFIDPNLYLTDEEEEAFLARLALN